MPGPMPELKRVSEELDRKVLAAADWDRERAEIIRGGKEVFWLAHEASPPGARLIAQSQCRAHWADGIMVPLFDFYRTKISRRAAGDRKTYFEEYHLYKM